MLHYNNKCCTFCQERSPNANKTNVVEYHEQKYFTELFLKRTFAKQTFEVEVAE